MPYSVSSPNTRCMVLQHKPRCSPRELEGSAAASCFSTLSPRPAARRFRPARANADDDWRVATDRLRSKSLPSRNPDICRFRCTAWPRPAGGLDRTLDRYDSLGNANIYTAPFAATYDFCSAKFGDFLRVFWKYLPARLLSHHLID